MKDWRSEFQYLLNRKILSRDELAYLFGQIKSIVERSMGSYIYNLVAKLTNNKYGPSDPPHGDFSEPEWADALQEYIKQLQTEIESQAAENDALCDTIEEVREEAAQVKRDFKTDEERQDDNEAKDKALLSAQQLMEWAESKCHLNCSGGYVPMMPHGDPEPCGWCITKDLIKQALKGLTDGEDGI